MARRRASRMVICRNENLIKHAAEVALNNLTAKKRRRREDGERGEDCRLDEKFLPPLFLPLPAFYVFPHFIGPSYFISVPPFFFFFLPLCLFSRRDSFYATFTFLDILLILWSLFSVLDSRLITFPVETHRSPENDGGFSPLFSAC